MRRFRPYPLGLHPPRGMPYWFEPSPVSPHLGHANHLCEMVKRGEDVETYKALVKNAKFMCEICGRVAAKAENLCEPIPL